MAGKVQGVTPQSRIDPFLCKDEALMGHKELQLPLCAEENIQENEKVQNWEELEGVGVWEMGLGVASLEFPVGSPLLPRFVSQHRNQLRAEQRR